MDTWPPWAVLWISIIDGGFIVPDTVIGVSSGQIGGRIVVIPCLGLIILGLHILCVLNKYVKKRIRANIHERKKINRGSNFYLKQKQVAIAAMVDIISSGKK